MDKCDIHNTTRKLERALIRLESREEIILRNRNKISEFCNYCLSIGMKANRRYKYFSLLIWLSRVLNKPYEDATKEDFIKILCDLEKGKYSKWSIVDRKVTIKRFYKWLKGQDEVYPQEVKWIKSRVRLEQCNLPDRLLTWDDVKKMANATTKPRDRAFITSLYESGCRIEEIITLQIKNIVFDKYGALIRVTGKTGSRPIRLVYSAPALSTWLNFHPFKDDPSAYVFCKEQFDGKATKAPPGYNAVRKLTQQIARKAGITKEVNPHAFRHARATELAKSLTESQLCAFMGWTLKSRMPAVYVHLSGRDIDNSVLELYGIQPEEKNNTLEQLIPCQKCGTRNMADTNLCISCDALLNKNMAPEIKSKPETQEKILESLRAEKVEETVLGTYGMQKDETDRSIPCQGCGFANSAASKFCNKCGSQVHNKRATTSEKSDTNLLDVFMKDPEFREVLLKKMKNDSGGLAEVIQ